MIGKCLFKVVSVYLLFVAIVNLAFFGLLGLHYAPVEEVYNNGLVIGIGDYAVAFVYGYQEYDCNGTQVDDAFKISTEVCSHYHKTHYRNVSMPTIEFVEELHSQGYNKVWGSWCHSGDYPYLIKYANGTSVDWFDWVSRNENKGSTIPVFTGFGFWRLSV